MKRIFIALSIKPEKTLLEVFSVLKSALLNENIKWIKPENTHITLSFLGDTDSSLIAELDQMLIGKCKGYGSFDIRISGLGLFKNKRDPRVIWAGIEPSSRLSLLYSTIFEGLVELDPKYESGRYSPHVTIGRIRRLVDISLLENLLKKYRGMEIQIIKVTEVILYESILSKDGPVYEPLKRYSLE